MNNYSQPSKRLERNHHHIPLHSPPITAHTIRDGRIGTLTHLIASGIQLPRQNPVQSFVLTSLLLSLAPPPLPSPPPPLIQVTSPTMAFLSIFRVATRAVRPASFYRAPQLTRSRVQAPVALATRSFGTTPKLRSGHEDETYEEFSARYYCCPLRLFSELSRAFNKLPRITACGL
jgi:hypothetical protein